MKRRYYKVGQVFNIGKAKYIVRWDSTPDCSKCALRDKKSCLNVACEASEREDNKTVKFERYDKSDI